MPSTLQKDERQEEGLKHKRDRERERESEREAQTLEARPWRTDPSWFRLELPSLCA